MKDTDVNNRVEVARRRDAEAWAYLFQLYCLQLYSSALRLVGNTFMARSRLPAAREKLFNVFR